MRYAGIIFDLDGTLLDTIEDLGDSMNAVLDRHGFPKFSTEEYKQFVGRGMRQLAVCALPESEQSKEKVDFYLAELEEAYGKRWGDKTRAYAGIAELLDTLEARGMRLFVLSNKPQPFVEEIVDSFFGHGRFALVYGAREGVPKKPDPYSAREISRISGIASEQMLYLGDSAVDMQTARAAGMYGVGAAWGFRGKEELWSGGARAVIEKPMDLPRILDAPCGSVGNSGAAI